MVQYATFQSNAAELPLTRKWLWRALVVSLVIHVGLLVFFHATKLEKFGNREMARLAPAPQVIRPFRVADWPDMDSEPVVAADQPVVKPIALAHEAPAVGEVRLDPQAPQDLLPLLMPEGPAAEPIGIGASVKNSGSSSARLEQQWSGLGLSLMDPGTKPVSRPTIQARAENGPGDPGYEGSDRIPGRTTIEEALAGAGGPIAVRGGALFEWGKAELQPDAIEDLQKLGRLIKLHPHATFIISGHTDHTGTHDGNLILSQQRADAVRDWLVTNLGIDPMRITTVGKADDEALPNLGPDRSVEEQAPNRRVEIVIQTNSK